MLLTKKSTTEQTIEVKLPAYYKYSKRYASFIQEDYILSLMLIGEKGVSISVANKNDHSEIYFNDKVASAASGEEITSTEFWMIWHKAMDVLEQPVYKAKIAHPFFNRQ